MKNFILIVVILVTGCAYMRFHGKSVRTFPDIHDSVVADAECLKCHHPDNLAENAPVSPHTKFSGCLKCHNDDLK